MSTSHLFYTVCKFGDSKQIRKFIEEDESLTQLDYGFGLSYACENKYMDIDTIELLISKCSYFGWNKIYFNACECLNEEIFEYIVKKCVEDNKLDWGSGLYIACSKGNIQIVKSILLSMHERNIKIDWNEGLHNAYISGNPELVDLMISKGADVGFVGIFRQDLFIDITLFKKRMAYEYKEYKQTQILEYTKMHESLVDFVTQFFKF